MRRAQAAAVATTSVLLASGISGCMTVHIEAKDGEVRTVRHAGLLVVQLASPQQAIVGSVSGVGLIGAPLGWSLGYTRQRWAAIGPECRAIAWLEAGDLSEPSRAALARVAGVCLIAAAPDGGTDSRMSALMEKTR